jgi:hypothetical protein
MLNEMDTEFDLYAHRETFAPGHQDLTHRLRTLLREDSLAEQTYRQLAHDIADPTADMVFGLLAHETEERCFMLQRIIDGSVPNRTTRAPSGFGSDTIRRRAAVMDIQGLAHGSRRHAQQLRDLACSERGSEHAAVAAILDTLARDSDKHASLLLELGRYLSEPDRPCVGSRSAE